MIARISRKTLVALALCALGACKEQPTRTHILLEVQVAAALADEVTRIVVYDLRSDASTEKAPQSADFKRGESERYVLTPVSDRSELRIRIVGLHDGNEIASATLTSRYAAGRGLFLNVELGCEGSHDLGEREATATRPKAIDNCAGVDPPTAGSDAGGSGGTDGGGGAGSGVQPGVAGASGSTGTPTNPPVEERPLDGGAGEGASGSDAAGAGAAGAGATANAGAAGTSVGGESGSGSTQGFTSGTGGASGTPVAANGGMGGTSGAGAGGAGAGGAGTDGAAGKAPDRTGCFTWFQIAQLTGTVEIHELDPGAYLVGYETRESSQIPLVPQYICRAAPSGMTTKLVGKGSKWGCYMPGPGTTSYSATQNVEILNSSNDAPCLAWKPLIATEAPPSAIRFGSGAGGETQVCYVEHTGTAEGIATSGPRVGQVRFENNQYVCRYEFYSSENRNMTLVNLSSEVTKVLDYAP